MSGISDLTGVGISPEAAAQLKNQTIYVPSGIGHIGGTAGFTNAEDTGEAVCPASQTGSTYVIPIVGLRLGDIIKSYKVIGQVESAGNTATVDADLRRLTNAAADPSDASLGAITQVSATADTAITSSKTLATAETLATGEAIYLLVTVTTAAATDVRLLGVELTVSQA